MNYTFTTLETLAASANRYARRALRARARAKHVIEIDAFTHNLASQHTHATPTPTG